MSILILFLAIVPLVAWALQRDVKRAVARREARAKWTAFHKATRGMAKALGAAIAPTLSKAVRAAAEFEVAWGEVSARCGKTQAQALEDMAKAMRSSRVEFPEITWALREHFKANE